MNTALEKQDHRVQIKLKNKDIWNVEQGVEEINQIRVWLDEITDWQPDMYTIKIHSQGRIMDVWFCEENHAILCALRWV